MDRLTNYLVWEKSQFGYKCAPWNGDELIIAVVEPTGMVAVAYGKSENRSSDSDKFCFGGQTGFHPIRAFGVHILSLQHKNKMVTPDCVMCLGPVH